MKSHARLVPVGAEVTGAGTHFRVWAPVRKKIEVVLDGGSSVLLEAEASGYFSGLVPNARVGSRYKFKLDGGETCPDPASRFQPEGPHGWSEVIDATAFAWTDKNWRGVSLPHQVIYEMHIGTFTKPGIWSSAQAELPHLADTGVTVLEVMPVAEFPGRFGWGYDGVQWFAPTRIYGSPDDFRRFVDRAHSLGLAVILDVVYNHLGPDGNYLGKFAPQYFCEKTTDWGPAINFDGDDCGPVREFVIANACYWIDEFHLDGLRLDATQDIHDSSEDHILRAMAREARRHAAPREVIFIAENEPQQVKLVKPAEQGGYGLDGLWNDDFHHTATVALTGHNEAYYTDYLRIAARIRFLHEVRLPLSRPALQVAEEAARHARPGHESARHGHLYPESRSDRQFGLWQALSRFDLAGAATRHYRADAACARNPDAFPRSGIRCVQSILVFCRS